MKIKLLMALFVALTVLSSAVSALDIRYTRTTTTSGDKVIRAELVNQDGHVVATGHSGAEGNRKSKKKEALEDAAGDYNNK